MAKKDLYRDLPIYIPDEEKKRREIVRKNTLPADYVKTTVTQPVTTNPGYTAVQPAQTVQPVQQPTEQPTGYQGAVSDALRRIADYGEYTSPYQPGIDAKYAAITGRHPFSYDLESDPQWAAYRKQYTRAGQMAYDDALAKLSARTGGLASSYAGGVAQQQYGDYMRQMTDKIPELYRLAYSMYADDAARDIADLNAIRGLDSDAYGRWNDAYGRLGDLYSLTSGERSYADARADKAAEDAIAMAKLGAQYKDYSGLRALGISPAVATGGGRSGGSVSKSTATAAEENLDQLYADAAASANPANYIASHYKEYGFTKSGGLVSGYNAWAKGMAASDTKEKAPISDVIAGLSGGMGEGEVRDILKQAGYDSTDQGNGWKIYNDEYGYDAKKATPRAQNLAVRIPSANAPDWVRDAWLQEVEDSEAYLTENDKKWLLAMAEGWGSYYG